MFLCLQSSLDSSPRNPSPVVQNGEKGGLKYLLGQIFFVLIKGFLQVVLCEAAVFLSSEDRHLCPLPSTTSSLLPSPGDPGADSTTAGPSFGEPDSVSIPEGSQIHSAMYIRFIIFASALHVLILWPSRCV